MQFSKSLRCALLTILVLNAVDARADLSAKQARKLITRVAGFELPTSDVQVKKISSSGDSSEANVEILTVFRFSRDEQGQWRIAEVRTGPNHWEGIDEITPTNLSEKPTSPCDYPPNSRGTAATDLTVKRARCLVASLLHVQLPSDAVRIKEVSPFAVPLSSRPSAVVVTLIQIEVRFDRSQNGWHVVGVRSGSTPWVNPDELVAAVNQEKIKRARSELATIATALERFKKEHGVYVVSEKQSVLIDHLSPHYLPALVRVDPWHRPYQYTGNRDHFSLRSIGADGTENTGDDIVVTPSSQTQQ